MAKHKPKPVMHIRPRGDRSWDWVLIGLNGVPKCKAPGVYSTKSNAKRAALSFAARDLKLRKVQLVEVA